jgi:hypothetical protein
VSGNTNTEVVNLVLYSNRDLQGTITLKGALVHIVVVNGTDYYKAPASYWHSVGSLSKATARPMASKWISTPNSSWQMVMSGIPIAAPVEARLSTFVHRGSDCERLRDSLSVSAEKVGSLDQIVRNLVDSCGVNLSRHVCRYEAGHELLVDHDKSDLDPIADFGVEIGALIKQLSVACPDLIVTRRKQIPIWPHDLSVWGIAGKKSFEIAPVVRGQLSVDHVAWRAHGFPSYRRDLAAPSDR